MGSYVAAQQGDRPVIVAHLGPRHGLIAGQILFRIDLGIGCACPREHVLGAVAQAGTPQGPSHQNPS